MANRTSWTVAAGNFLFHYRNALFPVIIALLVTLTRPQRLFDDPAHLALWLALGAATAVLGEAIRLLTIGYDYIDRGGQKGKVYASRLVQGGVYAHVRNPMYIGNIGVIAGILIFSCSPVALAIALPFFLFAYHAIIAAEEAYLTRNFGADYSAYVREVPRMVPRWSGLIGRLSAEVYDWRKALRKDYGNMYFLAMSFIVLSEWKTYFLNGPEAARLALPAMLQQIAVATVIYFAVMRLKKMKRLG